MAREKCVYCNKKITERSREHVIHNALGGLYESTDICCPECNNYVSKHIDVPFTKIFNPIVGNMDNMTKSHNKNSAPSYAGIVSYNGKQYEASIKGGKVISCPDLSRELRRNIAGLPIKIDAYKFDLDNEIFHTGIAKIAFNYAMAVNIDFDLISGGLNVTEANGNVEKIEYNYPMIPFYPMNVADSFLELVPPVDMFHNMILFSQSNQLCCYVDLFNTFQYYVLLSDTLPQGTKIYHNYTQTLKKIPRPEDIDISSPKDAMIYAQQYGVEPTMDKNQLIERIRSADLNKPSLDYLMAKKMSYLNPLKTQEFFGNTVLLAEFVHALPLYFDESETLIKENFRIWTPGPDGKSIVPYPDAIMAGASVDQSAMRAYTMAKFNKLNSFLLNKTK